MIYSRACKEAWSTSPADDPIKIVVFCIVPRARVYIFEVAVTWRRAGAVSDFEIIDRYVSSETCAFYCFKNDLQDKKNRSESSMADTYLSVESTACWVALYAFPGII